MLRACLVAGTHGWSGTSDPMQARGAWWWPGSPFTTYLESQGVPLVSRARPFIWSTCLDGELGDIHHRDWTAGGVALYGYLVPDLCPDRRVPPQEALVIAHSHGLQVALHAFAAGLQGALIDVCGPVRDDMMAVARAARPNIRCWLHLHAGDSDLWQILGSDWLGAIKSLLTRSRDDVGITREHPLADRNFPLHDVGHSGLLEEPEHFIWWDELLAYTAQRMAKGVVIA